jgi:5-methylcytosine-specific restriction endonuclease McrA
MIKLNINLDPTSTVPDKDKYEHDVSESLQLIANLVPNHKSSHFKSELWGIFKNTIWDQQGHKCAFCEKELLSSDDAQVEHFRPKTETRDENNQVITRESYWWLAYDHKNYIVACSTCNKLKGNRFPIRDEATRVKASNLETIIEINNEGKLGNEIPYTINPRYIDPEPHIAYNFRPDTKIVLAEPKDETGIGEKTIMILDLNRKIKNDKVLKDFLPRKRGDVLSDFRKELEKYRLAKSGLMNFIWTLANSPNNEPLKKLIDETESSVNLKRKNIKERFLSQRAQFSGMCSFWLKNDSEFENDFVD